MNRVTLVLGAILMTVSAGLVGQAYGYANGLERGKLEAAAKHDRDLVTQLSSAIKAGADLAKTANAASQTLRKSVSKFQSQYQPVIKEFNDALSETADGRAGCVFSPSVMQQLNAAQQRAATAASSGLSGSGPGDVPAPTTTTGEPLR